MRTEIRLVGARRTRAVLWTKETDVKRGVRAAVKDWGDVAVQIMKAFVPVRSGRLRDAIKIDSIDRVPGGWSVFVGPGGRVRYAAFVEYGTKDTPEQPYARPTNQAAAVVGPNVVTAAVRKAL